LEQDGVLLLAIDEFKAFVSKCKIDSSVLLPCVCTLFENNYYHNSTKRGEIIIDDGYLSIIAASTIDTYSNIWASAFTDIGFNNRLFLVPGTATRRFAIPEPIPKAELDKLGKRLVDIVHMVGTHLELEYSEDAKQRYEDWYLNRESSIHMRRLETYAMRLQPLLAVNEERDIVDLKIVDKSIALCDWQFAVRQEYDPLDADTTMAKMEGAINRALRIKGPLSNRDLQRAVNASRTGLWFFNKAVANLKTAEVIGYHKKKKLYFRRTL
jgi:hypothetical protein